MTDAIPLQPAKDPERVQHQWDTRGNHCVRCGALRTAITDGYVNILCGGKPLFPDKRKILAWLFGRAHTDQ